MRDQQEQLLSQLGRDKAGPMLAKIPLGRFAEVSDVVGCIVFLISDMADMV